MTCNYQITPDVFKEDYPEFRGVKDEEIQKFIDRLKCDLDLCECNLEPCQAQEISELWIAHKLTLNANLATAAASGAQYTSQRVGDMAWTKDAALSRELMLNPILSTPYGQQFASMMRMYCGGIYTT